MSEKIQFHFDSNQPHQRKAIDAVKESIVNKYTTEFEDKLKETLADRGIGFIHDCYSHPVLFNKLQKYMVEKL